MKQKITHSWHKSKICTKCFGLDTSEGICRDCGCEDTAPGKYIRELEWRLYWSHHLTKETKTVYIDGEIKRIIKDVWR